MHSSYKKRLYTNALSISTAVLLASSHKVKLLRTLLNQLVLLHLSKTSSSQRRLVLVQLLDQKWQVLAQQQKLHQALRKQVLETSSSTASDTASPAAKPENPVSDRAASTEPAVSLTNSTIYMSEKEKLTDTVKGQAQAAGKISWTLDDKPLEEWKTWDMETGTLSKDPFITVEENKNGNDLDVTFNVKELFGEDLSLRSPNNIRRTYRNYIGEHTLVGTSSDLGLTIRKNLTFRPYKDFHTHEDVI